MPSEIPSAFAVHIRWEKKKKKRQVHLRHREGRGEGEKSIGRMDKCWSISGGETVLRPVSGKKGYQPREVDSRGGRKGVGDG